jgi:hypothetical protein
LGITGLDTHLVVYREMVTAPTDAFPSKGKRQAKDKA